MSGHLIAPHGGTLVDLSVDSARAEGIKEASRDWASHDVTPRQLCDLELLLNGGFSPLTGFMTSDNHAAGRRHVVANADHARRLGGNRRTSFGGRQARAARRRRRDAGGAACRGHLAPRPRGGGGLRHHQHGASRGGPAAHAQRASLCRWAARRAAASGALRLQAAAAHAGRATLGTPTTCLLSPTTPHGICTATPGAPTCSCWLSTPLGLLPTSPGPDARATTTRELIEQLADAYRAFLPGGATSRSSPSVWSKATRGRRGTL